MEKTPAAAAIDWSIRLDRNLRSKNLGKTLETLKQVGIWLELWNAEPELHFAEYRMFHLLPSEDKLFLSAIFLRLADAFRFGNKQLKVAVVDLFRQIRTSSGGSKQRIFANCFMLEIQSELLSRVKQVFDGGDAEDRRLALGLFGCWANFAKDSADIRYIVLSSLVSADVLEVKAALFTAGCLCELSDDFAHIFLEMLTSMVKSAEVPNSIKLSGYQAFGKLCCSSSVAEKAYKVGATLLMESSEDKLSAMMLVSLSKIASSSMLLIPNQVELLTLFLNEDRSLHMHAVSLRCHWFILARGACNFPLPAATLYKLLGILQRSDYPPKLHFKALKVLHKISLFSLLTVPCLDITELFKKLLVVAENMLQSSFVATRVLSVTILSDLSEKLLGRADVVSGRTSSSLALQVISFVFNQVRLILTPNLNARQHDLTVELEVKSLLRVVFILVDKHSHLRCLVLHNLCSFIDKLTKTFHNVLDAKSIGWSDIGISQSWSNVTSPVYSKFMIYVSKIVVAYLQNLEKTGTGITPLLDALMLQLENLCHRSCLDIFSCMTYLLLRHLHATCVCLLQVGEDHMSRSSFLNLSCVDSIRQCDILAANYANKLVGKDSNWSSYKVGKLAACQGAWSTSAVIFEHIRKVASSTSFSCWLECLAQLSTSERQLQLFLFSDHGISIVRTGSNSDELRDTVSKANYCDYAENLLRSSNTLLSVEEILAAPDMSNIFGFQRWFLTLRAKFLKSVADIMNLLGKISFIQDGSSVGQQLEKSTLRPCTVSTGNAASLISTSTQISFQMRKLALELDLLLTSSMGIDRQSGMIVSSLALTCSLMAFTTGFAFLIPNTPSESYLVPKSGSLKEHFHSLLIEDLSGRLKMNSEIRTKFLLLLRSVENYKRSFLQYRSQNSDTYDARLMQIVAEYSVRQVLSLRDKGKLDRLDGDGICHVVNDGSQLLLNITSKLALIPFRTPSYFFRVRPCVSSELYVMDEDGNNVHGKSVSLGSHLSLTLCLQLKNLPASLPGQPTKVFCILNCKKSSQVTPEIGVGKRQAHWSRKDHEIDDLVDLKGKLLKYVTGVESHGLHCRSQADEYICFQVDKRGQGFSTCLLNVSTFPVGSYSMKWLNGFVDCEGLYWSLLPLNEGPMFMIVT